MYVLSSIMKEYPDGDQQWNGFQRARQRFSALRAAGNRTDRESIPCMLQADMRRLDLAKLRSDFSSGHNELHLLHVIQGSI